MHLCSYDIKKAKQYFLFGILFATLTGYLIPQELFLYRVINGCFCTGILLTSIGGLGFAAHFGGFNLLLYTYRKLNLYSKKNLENPSLKDPGSYYDYLSNKNK